MQNKLITLFATLTIAWTIGCATTNTPGRVLATTAQTVDAAMQGWWTYEALGQASPSDVASVRRAYADYQTSMAIAESAYIVSVKTGDQSSWTTAAVALRANQAALLALVTRLTQPTQPQPVQP